MNVPIAQADKRATPRFLFSAPVAYGSPDIEVNGSVANNISLGGISLKIQGFVPVGSIWELQLALGPSPQVVSAKAKVVRIKEISAEDFYEIGLQFIRDEECARAIGRYIMANRSESTNQVRS